MSLKETVNVSVPGEFLIESSNEHFANIQVPSCGIIGATIKLFIEKQAENSELSVEYIIQAIGDPLEPIGDPCKLTKKFSSVGYDVLTYKLNRNLDGSTIVFVKLKVASGSIIIGHLLLTSDEDDAYAKQRERLWIEEGIYVR